MNTVISWNWILRMPSGHFELLMLFNQPAKKRVLHGWLGHLILPRRHGVVLSGECEEL